MKYAAVLLLAAIASAQHEPAPGVGTAPPQPIPFSHKTHVGLSLKCLDCHKTAATAREATLPQEAFCMRCHVAIKKDSPAIQKLAAAQKENRAIEWARVYRLPDFVSFSHRRHTGKAQLACDACHGDVGSQDVLAKSKSIGMASCQSCHDARKANNGCDACHAPHPG